MKFNAEVTYQGLVLTFKLTMMNYTINGDNILYEHCSVGRHFVNLDFTISSVRILEITSDRLFLPGTDDSYNPCPRIYHHRFANEEELTNWLKYYKIGFKEINGCEPVVENMDFELEDCPNVSLA